MVCVSAHLSWKLEFADSTTGNLAEEEPDGESERLNKLAAFQLKMIRHAMTCEFLSQRLPERRSEYHVTVVPSVQRIAYSTCSVHATENEHVVRQALSTEEAINGKFKLALKQDVLPTWHRRGIPEEMDNAGVSNICYLSCSTRPEGCYFTADAESLVRCSPGQDRTNGFFVSLFIRTSDEDEWTGIVVDTKKRKSETVDDTEQPATKRKRKKKKKSIAVPPS